MNFTEISYEDCIKVKQEKHGRLYAIEFCGQTKIGSSSNVASRIYSHKNALSHYSIDISRIFISDLLKDCRRSEYEAHAFLRCFLLPHGREVFGLPSSAAVYLLRDLEVQLAKIEADKNKRMGGRA